MQISRTDGIRLGGKSTGTHTPEDIALLKVAYLLRQDIRTPQAAFLERQEHLLPTFALRFYSTLAFSYIPYILSVFVYCSTFIMVQLSALFGLWATASIVACAPAAAPRPLPLLLLILRKGWFHSFNLVLLGYSGLEKLRICPRIFVCFVLEGNTDSLTSQSILHFLWLIWCRCRQQVQDFLRYHRSFQRCCSFRNHT
jgi:hypothetical protein